MTIADSKCLICGAELTVHQHFRGGLYQYGSSPDQAPLENALPED